MKIAVLDDYQDIAAQMADWSGLAPTFFHAHCDDVEKLAQDLADFECIFLMRERTLFARALIEKLPRLRLLVTAGRKNAAIDVEAATEHGIQVCGTDTLGYPTAELTWALLLALARHIPQEVEALRQGHWQVSVGNDLHGKTLGLIGLGRLGRQVARIGNAFGMKVLAWSPSLTSERAAESGAVRAEKDAVIAGADFLSLHVSYNARTKDMIGAREFALMKPTAFLINTSRSPVVQETALLEALREKKIAGAGLDVLPQEPLPRDYPLLALDNVIATPHLGYVTADNYRMIYGQGAAAIRAYLSGLPLDFPLNRL